MSKKWRQKIVSTLRGRLVLWYLSSLGLIFFLFSGALGSLFWITLQNQIDHHLEIAVNEAWQIVENYQAEERNALIKNLVSAQGMTVVVLSTDGTPLLETNSPDIALSTEHRLQKIMALRTLSESSPVYFTEGSLRFAAKPVAISSGKGMVAVGYSNQVLSGTFYKMLALISASIFFLVLPTVLIGYKLLKKQLSPLEEIARQAESLKETSLLTKRIQISSSTEELQAIKDALNLMLARLEEIFKNEQKFFSDAAHTLKTPLSVFRAQIENAHLPENDRKEILKTIDGASETIKDLLFLSRINSYPGNLEMVSLTELMANLTELASTLAEERKIKVVSHIEKNVCLKADEKLLKRAVSNLVYNAVAYSRPAGKIELSLVKMDRGLTITVSDNGIGIAKEDLPKVFTRFFRGANAPGGGSGLGLAIAKAVIESLGGKISLTSFLNKGTTVSIIFE